MRFVHVEDFVHPDAGYQLNLLGRLQVKQGHEVIIVTSELDNVPDFLVSFFGKDNITEKDEKYYKETGVKILRYPTHRWYSSRAIFKKGLNKFIKSLQPDVLFIHGEDTLTGMNLLWNYKKMNVPYVLDCHMLEMASKNKLREAFRTFFRTFITPIILKNQIPLIRVVDSDFVEKHFGIPLEKTQLLSFGTDTDYFKPDEEKKAEYRKDMGLSHEDFVVLYAGKLDVYKGGLFLANSLKERINLKNDKKLKIIIVGNTSKDDYGKSVDEILVASENEILRFPTQTYSNLERFYKVADVALFPKQCSMSYFEVQSSGVPVILEENEINVERASDNKGLIFEPGNMVDLRNKIIQFAEMEKNQLEKFQNNARANILKNYDYLPIAQQFTDIMVQEYNRFHKQ
ncbi:glycosyltransferase family 4 protein [Chryseobacterium sp.]|uniref:glycosyltransferase family 4 protein n=1 Tax=Chryseobacterium sp. TaxID=1871047 RepID=UPI00289A7692|nr:glycosyltransferase family 4 protein [Chryseobacterium sp.]